MWRISRRWCTMMEDQALCLDKAPPRVRPTVSSGLRPSPSCSLSAAKLTFPLSPELPFLQGDVLLPLSPRGPPGIGSGTLHCSFLSVSLMALLVLSPLHYGAERQGLHSTAQPVSIGVQQAFAVSTDLPWSLPWAWSCPGVLACCALGLWFTLQ